MIVDGRSVALFEEFTEIHSYKINKFLIKKRDYNECDFESE